MQREFQKQMGSILAVPMAKEVKKMEAALGQRMEKALKAHADALWARLQEENVKHEKIEKERTQQLTLMLTSIISKEMPVALERAVKKELSSIGSHVTRLVIPSVEKAISTAVNESFQVCFLRNPLGFFISVLLHIWWLTVRCLTVNSSSIFLTLCIEDLNIM